MADQPSDLPPIDSLWNYGDPAATEAKFRELLPKAEQSGEVAYRLELLTQLARTQSLQRKYVECHAILDDIERQVSPDMPRVIVRMNLERGRAFNDTLKFDQAKACFARAWDLASAERIDGLAVDAAHMFGVMDPPEEAIAWNDRALAYAEASDDPAAKRWRGTLLNNQGWMYHKAGRYADALKLFQELVDLHGNAGRAGPLRIAQYSVAKTLRLMGRVEESLAIQRELAATEPPEDPDGYTQEELAECLLALGQPTEAKPHFAKAYELLSKDPWFPPPEADRLKRLGQLGGLLP